MTTARLEELAEYAEVRITEGRRMDCIIRPYELLELASVARRAARALEVADGCSEMHPHACCGHMAEILRGGK